MVKEKLLAQVSEIKMGDVTDFGNFMGAVIDRNSLININGYLEYARSSTDLEILVGGGSDDSTGYFVEPTVVQSMDPQSRLMSEEIFGPVLTIHVYPEKQYEETLQVCDQTSPYALTGAIFALDRRAIVKAMDSLRHAAGNFYVNDKPTGAVVGQQPFGGSRASGTNDKAGSWLNLERWVTPADDQGDVPSAHRLPLPVHGGRARRSGINARADDHLWRTRVVNDPCVRPSFVEKTRATGEPSAPSDRGGTARSFVSTDEQRVHGPRGRVATAVRFHTRLSCPRWYPPGSTRRSRSTA